jgi:transposase
LISTLRNVNNYYELLAEVAREAKAFQRTQGSQDTASGPDTPAEREARDLEAVSLRLTGHTYEQIAEKIGVANRGVAYKMVQRGLSCNPESTVEQLALELLRLNCLVREIGHRLQLETLDNRDRLLMIDRTLSTASRLFCQLLEPTALGHFRSDAPETLPSLDYFDGLAFLFPRELLAEDVIKSSARAMKSGRRIAGAAGWSTGLQARRDARAAALREQGMTFDQIAAELDLANRSVAQKMVSRSTQRSASRGDSQLAEELDRLRRQQLTLFADIMIRDWPARDWNRLVRRYLAVTRRRCELLHLFPRKRSMLGSSGSGSMSDSLKAEWKQTDWVLMLWRRRSRGHL